MARERITLFDTTLRDGAQTQGVDFSVHDKQRIAAELDAEKLILATGAAGILEDVNDSGSLISYVDRTALRKLRDEGKLADGMLPKAAAIEAALDNGVQRVHVISYKVADSLLLEVFTNEGTGTLVVDDIGALTLAEQASAGEK